METYLILLINNASKTFLGESQKLNIHTAEGTTIPVSDTREVLEFFGRRFVLATTHFMIMTVTGWSGYLLEMIQIGPCILRYFRKKIAITPRQEHSLNETPGKLFIDIKNLTT
jgi:hypothetical protein